MLVSFLSFSMFVSFMVTAQKTFHRKNQNATFLSYSHPTDFCFTTKKIKMMIEEIQNNDL